MDIAAKRALEQIDLAEAELAVLKQEQVLREVLRKREPTAEATTVLQELRQAVR
jgi:hypothetical protein